MIRIYKEMSLFLHKYILVRNLELTHVGANLFARRGKNDHRGQFKHRVRIEFEPTCGVIL